MRKPTTKAKTESASTETPDSRFLPVIEAFSGEEAVSLGRNFGSVGLRSNGKAFAMLVKGRFVAKLPKERVAQLVATVGAAYFDFGNGRLMKEWVALSGREELWVDIAKEARKFVDPS